MDDNVGGTVRGGSAGWSYDQEVPVIATFFGIVIRTFYREHGVAHFHAA